MDLNQIVDYIVEASGNRQTAIRYIRRIKARCKRIGDVPRGGRKREDLLRGMRMVPFERSAAICYLIENDRVLITNIFYGGRDIEAFFHDGANDPGDE